MLKRIIFKYFQFKYSLRWIFERNNCIVINAVFAINNKSLMSNNWGDDINYMLPQIVASKKCIPYNILFNFVRKRLGNNILCIGSIIPWLVNQKSIIWGSGVVDNTFPLDVKPQKVLSVRGPLTRNYLLKNNIDCPEIYGDPALLLPLYYKPQVQKKYKLGVIPHKIDFLNPQIKEFKNRNDILVINIKDYNQDWRFFIDRINECEAVISSSLHGLIISEAYKIPSVWVKWSDNVIGGNFKFQDFYLSIGKENQTPLDLRQHDWSKNIYRVLDKWIPGTIDLNPMLNSCPF